MLPTLKQLNGMVLRPFKQPVDLETVLLLLALLLIAAGGWHMVLERIEL
jgi:uncharacterized membrane protein